MDCTHPVLYMRTRDGAMICHICGKVLPQKTELPTIKTDGPNDTKPDKPKPAPKRGRKTKAD